MCLETPRVEPQERVMFNPIIRSKGTDTCCTCGILWCLLVVGVVVVVLLLLLLLVVLRVGAVVLLLVVVVLLLILIFSSSCWCCCCSTSCFLQVDFGCCFGCSMSWGKNTCGFWAGTLGLVRGVFRLGEMDGFLGFINSMYDAFYLFFSKNRCHMVPIDILQLSKESIQKKTCIRMHAIRMY